MALSFLYIAFVRILWVPRMSPGDPEQDFRGLTPHDETGPWPCRFYAAFVRILELVRLSRHDNEELAVEVVMLRHEVAVLRRQVARPALRPTDRALFAGLSRHLGRRRLGRFFVQPETLLFWHRDLVRRKWIYAHRPGRPSIPAGTVEIILRLARENPTLGYRRIQGELTMMGVALAPSSVWAILRRTTSNLWVPEMSSGYVELDFRGLTPNNETGPWRCRFSPQRPACRLSRRLK